MPTTSERVRQHLGIVPARPVDDMALDAAVSAANDLVATFRPDLTERADMAEGEDWPARAEFAATLQAARFYGRRSSVQGVAAFQEVGVSMLPRLDPDVRVLLELGEYQPSATA